MTLAKIAVIAALLPLVIAALGCTRKSPDFPALAEEFVYTTLSFSPSSATQTGLHEFTDPRTGTRIQLDMLLDDFSAPARDRQRSFCLAYRARLQQLDRSRFDAQTQADYDLLMNSAEMAIFNLDREKFTGRRPQLYPESLGNALFSNISLEYSDKATRASHLAARLEHVPAFIDTAIANLETSDPVGRKVGIEEMDGVTDLIRTLGAQFVSGTPSEARYSAAQAPALAAIEKFNSFVRDSLPQKPASDWRMGPEMFEQKWRYYLQASVTPAEMLKLAEDGMQNVRREMLELAKPLHDSWFPTHRHPDPNAVEHLNTVVGEVLARIGEEHVGRDQLVSQGEKDVAELERFVVEHRVLSQTDFSNLKVIPTPVFMRGIYGVGGAVFAPALQPKLSSFYWVTPIAADSPDERAESHLREYNRYKMLTLSIHEAVPGHIVQGDYANRVKPEWRRLLRAVYGAGTYIEGWAVYAEQMMEALGVNGGDPVKMHLTALKAMLRLYANVIIDIRLHTMNMPEADAVTLMIRDGFQEKAEAIAKLQRAQLDYVQLNLYAVGFHEWTELRKEAEQREGSRFSLCRFHDTLLSYGPVPVPVAKRLYFDGVAPSADLLPSRCQ